MKKRLLFLGVIVLVSFTVILLRENVMLKSKINIGTGNIEKVQQKDMLSMMLETDAGSGNYELTTRDSWPTEGYIFNSTLSKCENGGELSWDDENKRVLMSGNVSDKCYVYFDLDNKITLANYIISQYNGVQGNNNIYYHDNSLENGAGDNSYRYAGSSETTNNFVCFGSDEAICPEDNLYRIIGVFEGQVKLIKAYQAKKNLLGNNGDYDTQDNYYWNRSSGTANWDESNLNKINLNINFLTNLDEKWQNMIVFTNWHIDKNILSNNQLPNAIFKQEIVNSTNTYNAKVALMYLSDFVFAISPSEWDSSYNSNKNDENWLFINTSFSEWMITNYNSGVAYFFGSGTICFECNGPTKNSFVYDYSYYVRPVFFLNKDIKYNSGLGSIDNPIRLS